MSEPMSSVEIEDVLSSIRRLVSEDMRPQARPVQAQVPAVEAPALAPVADKLVLTPSLRIVPDPVPEPASTADSMDMPVFHSVRHGDDTEAGFIAIDDDAAPEPLLLQDMPAPDSDAYDDDGAAAPVGFVGAVPDAVFAEPEPDLTLQAEPPSSDAGAADWADAAEAAARAELEQETAQTAYARFLDTPEDAEFDEDAIREMVRDIIREELQGALGERITRNVRKLVRAEIARALAVRDFE